MNNQLVMWSLARQFRLLLKGKAFFCLLLFFIFSAYTVFAEDAEDAEDLEIIDSEVAIYRINNNVIYHSQFIDYYEALQTMRCLPEKTFVLKSLGLETSQLESLPEEIVEIDASSEDSLELLSRNSDFLNKVLNLLLAQSYANRFRLSIDREQLNALFPTGDCGLRGSFAQWSEPFRQMVQAEFYFRDRFLPQKVDSSSSEANDFQQEDLVELKSFIKGLFDQFDQGVFYQAD